LGLARVPAFDLSAVCTGFVYGLATVAGFLETGIAERVLLIGSDTFSTILDPADRSTAAVFGDGAGAVVLRRGNIDEPGALLAFDLGSDGDLTDLITVRAGGSKYPLSVGQAVTEEHRFTMQGRAVYRQATRWMTASANAVLAKVGWQPGELDWFVGHQANQRILDAVGRDLGIAPEHVYVNVDRVGNTVAASIPLALADANADGALRSGHKVLLTAFGGGLTWGSVALTWPEL
jgi:3-oxoacyl-[acyl-carrier-protein] synthase-3